MALAKMDPECTLSQAHPESMDFLSSAWCNFALHAFQDDTHQHSSIVVQDNKSIKNTPPPSTKMDKSANMDDGNKYVPPWKANDLKSWIWMQQAMHPEVNYSSYFRKKWIPWKLAPFKHVSIKKWLKEIKQKRKEDERIEKAQVHAAISVAGVAAALAAIAAENSQHSGKNTTTKDSAVASAAALVAAQCAKVAEAMGAKREQLSTIIGSAITGTSASEIVTLTASAATSIRGADTLKARSGYKTRLNGSSPVLPLEDNNEPEPDFDFDNCRSILEKGAELNIETADGRNLLMKVTVTLTSEGKVVLKLKKINLMNPFTRQKEYTVLDMHAELYKEDSEAAGETEIETGYYIVLTTNKGVIKLDMMCDYKRYRMWSITINHMLMLSTTFTKYDLQFYKI
ncbi:VAN3-binding protein isoform X2 [Andrographis paniculata]|uniref:VAN3-binding protein isoform X2 n=1 Tax=Andrographis paniculata TaxID=175694 RepID=UPI0021E848B1|nr:VAN3-binding protein isoform X2 [Andrographis paniculata]